MAGNPLLRLTPVFGAAAVAIYLIGYEQTATFASTDIRRPLEDVLAAQRVVTDVVMEPTAFACVFFTLAALSFWHLARARPTSRVLLAAGLLTPPYLLGLYVVGKANPANYLLRLGREAADEGHSVAPEVIGLGWSPPALAVVLAAAAIAQVWGVLRLARGLEAAPSPRAARLMFLQPAWCAAYLAACACGIWVSSVTPPPVTPEEAAWGGVPEGVVRDAWRMLESAGIALAVASAATVAMGIAARRGSARVRVLAGMVTPLYVLGLVILMAVGPLGPLWPAPAAEIRPFWHIPVLTTLVGGAMISYLSAVSRSTTVLTQRSSNMIV